MEFALDTSLDNVNWATAVLALFICVIFYAYIQWMHMLPGPMGLPYLGYYPFLGKDFHLELQNMTKKYGDVFCINCTGQLYVYLGSTKVIKEAHLTKSDCFTERPTYYSIILDSFGNGVAFENSEKWKELRKFFVQRLKEFGLGKGSQETVLRDYLEKTVNTLHKSNGENFDALKFFAHTCARVVYSMLLSGTKADDNAIGRYNEAYAIITEAMVGKKLLFTGPLLRLMINLHPQFRRYRKCKLILDKILTQIIEEHEKDFDKDNIRDLVDCYINMRKELEQKEDPRSKIYTGIALRSSLMQFLGDGGYSVGFTVAQILNELLSRPEMQKEIQREIDSIVGHSRFPSWDDKIRMPYTNAFIYECFRTTDFFPVFPSLECTKETTVDNCRVPKGAVTLVGFWASFHDPDVYEQPEKFDPTRFLPNDEGKPKSELPSFFGFGKRSCIGEPMVLMQTFLFFTTVLQNFDLHPPKEDKAGDQSAKEKPAEAYSIVFRATPRSS